jgi:hypothetical protein
MPLLRRTIVIVAINYLNLGDRVYVAPCNFAPADSRIARQPAREFNARKSGPIFSADAVLSMYMAEGEI